MNVCNCLKVITSIMLILGAASCSGKRAPSRAPGVQQPAESTQSSTQNSVQKSASSAATIPVVVPAQATVESTSLAAFFGSVAIGESFDKVVTLDFSNRVTDITNFSVTLPANFAFAGGSYPGTGGTCGTVISTASCTLNIRFSPPSIATYDAPMSFTFTHDGANQSVAVTLRGEGGLVLGSSSFAVNLGTQYGLNQPYYMGATDAGYFIVDNTSNRIKIYNTQPTSAVGTPDLVLGQADNYGVFTGAGGNLSPTSLELPRYAKFCGGKFFVSDSGNHRVLVWNSMPTTTGQAPDIVLGQANFTSGSANRSSTPSASTLSTPVGIDCFTIGSTTMLFIADRGNHRVLVWNNLSALATGAAADQVLGQADFTGNMYNRSNSATPADNSFRNPGGIVVAAGKLFVADQSNNRVLAFNLPSSESSLTLSGTASFTLGQSTFSGATGGTSTLNGPTGVASDGTSLAVSELTNNRVLIWSAIPAAFTAPNFVIGQALLTTGTANNTANSGNIDGKSLSGPMGVAYVGSRLHVADTANNRVVVFANTPSSNHVLSSFVIGQIGSSLDIAWSHPSITGSMVSGMKVYADNDRLIAADPVRHRVLIWSAFPTSNNQAADVVLGQADFTSGQRNRNGTPSCATMWSPDGVHYDGTRLYVSDEGNNRVLVWNSLPTTNGAPADIVLGQPDCATRSAGSTAAKLSAPHGVHVVNNTLFVSDYSGLRIVAYSTSALATGQAASFVLKWTTTDCAAATTVTMAGMEQVFSDGARLYIPDRNRSRIVVFDPIPVAATCPSYILGQPNGASSSSAGDSYTSFLGGGAFDSDGNLYLMTRRSKRIDKFNAGNIPTATGYLPTSSAIWGSASDGFSSLQKWQPLGGFGYYDSYTPAIAGNRLIVGDSFGRISIVPKP